MEPADTQGTRHPGCTEPVTTASSALEFSAGLSLEDLILRHALGADTSAIQREPAPAGVMMLPIPRAGILREVRGKASAASVRRRRQNRPSRPSMTSLSDHARTLLMCRLEGDRP